MDSPARQIHKRAEETRENSDFTEALKLTDEATVAYQSEGDSLGLSEVQSSRTITLRHLYENTQDKNYLVIAKYTAQAAVEIAKVSGLKGSLAIPYFNLAKIQEELDETEQAVISYQNALDNIVNNPQNEHNRPGVIADFKIHLYTCAYKTGDKSAREKAEQALTDLMASDEKKYNKDVWVSGAHMKIAAMLQVDDISAAQEHLQKARKVIEGNPDLKLRQKQWEKLSQTFS
ncbi:MAG: hypothetical protein Q7R49_05285 [Candidatus Daviesbacteria bacterium]|nr:hypothetical protein [Candidatus Daviesbacteria bacterium]